MEIVYSLQIIYSSENLGRQLWTEKTIKDSQFLLSGSDISLLLDHRDFNGLNLQHALTEVSLGVLIFGIFSTPDF